MTTYLEPIRTMLEQNYPQPNPLWNYSTDNTLADGWLLATPSDVWGLSYSSQFKQAVPGSGPLELQTCTVADGPTQLCQAMNASMTAPGQQPSKLLIGHSDDIVDAMYDVMISARYVLDITSLAPPAGRFLESLKNALKYLSSMPYRPLVRILVSNPLPDIPPVTADPLIRSLTDELDASKGLEVYVYVMSSGFTSWNHAKIVAADGVRAIVGGHNQFGKDYLGVNPVNDVSMRVTGTAAWHAQDFANSMWVYGQWVADQLPSWFHDWRGDTRRYMSAYRPPFFPAKGPSEVHPGELPAPVLYSNASVNFPLFRTGSIPILSVGRGADTKSAYLAPTPESYKRLFNEPSDEAIVKLVSLAQRTIRMSLQSFRLSDGLVAGWNPELLGAMAEALYRGVIIKVVTSNRGAVAGGDGDNYSADQLSTVNAEIVSTMVERIGLAQDKAEQIAAQRLSIATFRYSSDTTYPGNVPIGNHAKTVIVDDSVFYIGSQNMYTCNLNEFGYIVEDATAAQAYVDQYWTPLWNWSKVTATTDIDPDVKTMHQVEAMEFILALRADALLRLQWTALLTQYRATTDSAAEAAIEKSMNQLMTSAGFSTTAVTVLAALDQPFFTDKPPSTAATPEALRFVANLMSSSQLMTSYFQIVMAPYDSPADAADAVNKFLTSNGYSCTPLQVISAYWAIQNKNLAYWTGVYTTYLTDDGGITYATGSKTPAASSGSGLISLGPKLAVFSGAVLYDNVPIVNPTYNKNTLAWSTSDGNATSASLQFGTVTRPTLNGSYVGAECFGTITYPGTGNAGYQGTNSLYGFVDTATDSTDQAARGANTLRDVGIWLGVGALIVLLFAFALRRATLLTEQQRRAARDYKDRGGTPDDPGFEMGDLQTRAIVTESVEEVALENMTDSLEHIAKSEPGMTVKQRNKLSSFANDVRNLRTQLQDPPAADLPDVVKTASVKLTGMNTTLKTIVDDAQGLLTQDTLDTLNKNITIQKDIGDVIAALDEQEGTGKLLDFGKTEIEGL